MPSTQHLPVAFFRPFYKPRTLRCHKEYSYISSVPYVFRANRSAYNQGRRPHQSDQLRTIVIEERLKQTIALHYRLCSRLYCKHARHVPLKVSTHLSRRLHFGTHALFFRWGFETGRALNYRVDLPPIGWEHLAWVPAIVVTIEMGRIKIGLGFLSASRFVPNLLHA